MNLWLDAIAAALVASAGAWLGHLFSRLPKPYWMLGYFILGFLVDHCVTVLEVTDSEVVVGDPLDGLDRMSYGEFLKKWRFAGIVLKRRR